MRRLLSISVLVLLYFIFAAKSCDGDDQFRAAEEQNQINSAKDSIADIFTSVTLSNQALLAFEATARLKMYDFRDYLKLLSDTATSDVFNAKVAGLTGELFISREVRLNLSCSGAANENDNLNKTLKKSGFKNIKISQGVVFDSVTVNSPLQKVSDSLYSGTLKFRLQCADLNRRTGKLTPGVFMIIDIFVAKRENIFGTKSIRVWTILLGDIH